ncbi:tRNA (guanine-N(7)-)-methyltransferase non-catalytic subunit wuho [Arctopsyche grandis]|uniref:tRNA (guanine-N(7)-)-methyltransferase non-catalytic subunit wuho n=1 Tax=Arctopsyche grandis TaxID=121162 RepID=UPI00406D982D
MRQMCTYDGGVLAASNGQVWKLQMGAPPLSVIKLPDCRSNAVTIGISVSPDGNTLAVLNHKVLWLYETDTLNRRLSIDLPRAASEIRFTFDSQHLLVADKTGDGYIVNTNSDGDSIVKIVGNLSMLLDILMDDTKNFVISCDRDEKIKVSCYPRTYEIQSFCLGHREFITCIDFLPHDKRFLISASGDGTVKIWDYVIGKEILSIDVNEHLDGDLISNFKKIMKKDDVEADSLPINHMTVCKIDETSSFLGVSNYSVKSILLYIIEGKNSKLTCKLVSIIKLRDSPQCFVIDKNRLWVYCHSTEIYAQEWDLNNTVEISSHVLVSSENCKAADNDFLTLYKRKFDNLQVYQMRKKQRLDGHQK